MINALAIFGLCMLLTIIFSVIYIVVIFQTYEEEATEYAGAIILAVAMFFIFSIITANTEISRQNLIKQIELMEDKCAGEIDWNK